MDVGILGGTFDPVHLGHLKIAEEARVQLKLEKVLFVPANKSALKVDRETAAVAHRLEMLKLAIAAKPYFEPSYIEVDRPGISYTVDTVELLKKQLGAGAKLFFIIGMDSLLELPQWKNPTRLLKLCHLAVFPRPGFERPDLSTSEVSAGGINESVVWLMIEPVDISATDIRRRIACGLPIRKLVSEDVERYIIEHGLYRP